MTRTRLAVAFRVPALAAALVALAAAALAAPKPPKTTDVLWTRPDLASLDLKSVAMLPVATFDNSVTAQKSVERAVGFALRSTGYRWLSASTVVDLARGDADAEALLKSARDGVLTNGRVDSLVAPKLCARLRTDAVLAVRIDQWEQHRLEPTESGKPSTAVHIRAALVDSLGRLLWRAESAEFAEGPYQEANAVPPGASSDHFSTGPATGGGTAPSYDEVLDRIMLRWAPAFPHKAAAPAPAPAKTP